MLEPTVAIEPKAKAKISRELLMQLIGLFTVATVVVWGTLASDKQLDKFMPESRIFPSIANHKPSGLSAMHELCQRVFKDRRVDEWDFPYRKLADKKNAVRGVLVIVGPDDSLAQFEAKEIADWVERGNYLLYLDDFQLHSSKKILELMHLGAHELDTAIVSQASDAHTSEENPLYEHLRTLIVSSRQSLSGGKTMVAVKDKPVLVEKTWGKGRVLIGASPSLIANRYVSKIEYWSNFQFVCNWLGTTSGDILFDEKCHGSTRGTNVVFFFLRGPAGMVISQLLLILAIGVLSCHQRFGAVTLVKNNRRISNLEHINGLAGTYYRAQARQTVLSIIWASVRLKLCKLLQINPHDADEQLEEALRKQALGESGGDSLAMKELVDKIEAGITRKDLTDNELRELVAACDNITKRADNLLTTTKEQG